MFIHLTFYLERILVQEFSFNTPIQPSSEILVIIWKVHIYTNLIFFMSLSMFPVNTVSFIGSSVNIGSYIGCYDFLYCYFIFLHKVVAQGFNSWVSGQHMLCNTLKFSPRYIGLFCKFNVAIYRFQLAPSCITRCVSLRLDKI